MPDETIVALGSGRLPSGIAVVRLSGPGCRGVLKGVLGHVPPSRRLVLGRFCEPGTGAAIDHGLAVYFPKPHSFTGLDCAELHCHGGVAVVARLIEVLTGSFGCRLALAGEFSRQAFENGRLDLTEVEGLGDLVQAETEGQRVLALARANGELGHRLREWRGRIVELQAHVEADLDFSDEGDVPSGLATGFVEQVSSLEKEIESVLALWQAGKLVRDGIQVTIAGAPNSGKSTLLNTLARSDVAIVDEMAGTTRDVLEVPVDLGGQLFVFADTAGLHNTTNPVEIEGMRRARARMGQSDLVVGLRGPGEPDIDLSVYGSAEVWRIASKIDLLPHRGQVNGGISAVTGAGLEHFYQRLERFGECVTGDGSPVLVARARDRAGLNATLEGLREVSTESLPELRAEALRQAATALGRMTGQIDAEQVLDALFSQFCIGK